MMRILAPAFVLSASLGCAKLGDTATSLSESRSSPTFAGPAEAEFCANPTTYATKVTVTGTARYRRRVAWGDYGAGGLGSARPDGAHPVEERPIRQAEVRATDPSGRTVQCATTNDRGEFSVDLPAGDVAYLISVSSRAQGVVLNASVLNKPEFNRPYALGDVRRAVGQPDPVVLTAAADGDVLGGAFNILDMIYEANRYLRARVGACSMTFPGCRDVNDQRPIPKVTAYWEKGFNPNSYFGSTSGLSFYLPGHSRLFILGGEEGDVDHSDTDHFDNSVIVHEYGHFLEDQVGHSDSPGGVHNGNRVIDPRLAWSEGWGNFFQAAVLNQPAYVDTTGNEDGFTALAFDVNLETGDYDTDETAYDVPENDGEGEYREFSVSRLLWDAIDDTPAEVVNGAPDDVNDRFAEIWSTFSSDVGGFRAGAAAFRNVGLLHQIQRGYRARGLAADWSNLRTIERQSDDAATYGRFVTPGSCAATLTAAGDADAAYRYALEPAAVASDFGTLATSHLFLNNRFFHLRVTAPGPYAISLDYVDADHAGPKATLNLYLYNAGARFGVARDILARSTVGNQGSVDRPETKTVSAYLTPGDYLINVNVDTRADVGGPAYYNLRLGSAQLCPSNLFPR